MKTNTSVSDDTASQIIVPNARVHILPAVNLTYYKDHGLFEKHLIEWCKQLCDKEKVFLDIGAHSGTYTIELAHYSKHVYSFEPQKMTYYSLCGSVALSGITNVDCLQLGLGSKDQSGIQTLHIVSNDGGGSTLHKEGHEHELKRTEQIQVVTLDSIGITDTVGFIKMDVEENELQVLLGAKELIQRCQPKILFESNRENPALFDYLKTILGYNIISVGGVNNMFLAEPKILVI
jgi:FkbM family methyltransferase